MSYLRKYVPFRPTVYTPAAPVGMRERASTSIPRILVSPRLVLVWAMFVICPGQPGHVGSGAARVMYEPYLAWSARMASGEMPEMIVSFKSIDHQSSAREALTTGSHTTPSRRVVGNP